MLHIARQFIKQKKSVFLICSILSVVLALLIIIVPLFQVVIDSYVDSYMTQYGKFHFIIQDIKKEEALTLLQDISYDEIGWVQLCGDWENSTNNATIKLGAFDENAYDLSRINLLEGRFPTTTGEIALEEGARYWFAETELQIGDEITLSCDEIEETFVVTGIIRTFLQNWDKSTYAYTEEGFKNPSEQHQFPRGIVAPAYGLKDTYHCLMHIEGAFYKTIDVYLYGETLQQETYAQKSVEEMVGKLSAQGIHYIENRNFYTNLETKIEPIRLYKTLFTIVLWIGALLIIGASFAHYINHYKNAYATLYSLGAELEFVFGVYQMQIGIVIGFSLVFGCIFAFLSNQAIAFITGKYAGNLYTQYTFLFVLLFFLLTSIISLFYYYQSIRPLRSAFSSNTSKISSMRMRFVMHMPFGLAASFFKSNWKRMIIVLLLIGMLSATMVFSVVRSGEDRKNYIEILKGESTSWDFGLYLADDNAVFLSRGINTLYSMKPGKGYNYTDEIMMEKEEIEYGNISLKERNQYAPIYIDDVIHLQEFSGIEQLDIRIEAPYQIVIPVEDKDVYDDYWGGVAKFAEPSDEQIEEEISFRGHENWQVDLSEKPQNAIFPLYCSLDIILLNETSLAYYHKFYPEQVPKEGIPEGESVLILPKKYTKKDNTPLCNTLLKSGSKLDLYWIDFPKDMTALEVQKTNSSFFKYKQTNVPLYSIIDEKKMAGAVMLCSGSTAKSLLRVEQCQIIDISINMKKEATQEEYDAVKAALIKIGSHIQNPSFSEDKRESVYHAWLLSAVDTSNILLFAVFGGFCIFSIYTVVQLSLQRRRQSLGVFRALGLRKKTLFSALFIELFVYWLLAMLVALLCSYPIFKVLWASAYIKGNYFVILPLFIWPTVVGIPICILLAIMLSKQVYKDSIYTVVREHN